VPAIRPDEALVSIIDRTALELEVGRSPILEGATDQVTRRRPL
jgi:hypothetical protein